MYSRHWAFSLVCSLAVTTVVGCYSTYPSSVYGPGGYPGTFSAPPAGAYPQGGSYVLPGTPSQPLPGSGSTNRWQAPSGGNAPPYEPTPHGHDNLVPEYDDSADPGGQGSPNFDGNDNFESDTEDFGAPDPAGGNSLPFGEAAARSSDGDPFMTPAVSLSPVSTVRTVVDTDFSPASAPSPYKHDREDFRWLRGVVDYDGKAKTWNIIYDLEPDAEDQYGGSIVLSNSGRLRTLKHHDVVLVEGRVDAKRRDAFGKPTFHVDRLVELEAAE